MDQHKIRRSCLAAWLAVATSRATASPATGRRSSRRRTSSSCNFITTNDIVGGNSGSLVINANGELVGLAFDGNVHSLPGYFIYEGNVNRMIAVDMRGMIEALRNVYKADALVGELTVR